MEAHDDVPTDNHQVANTSESDTRNVPDTRSPPSTDSMVNVRLSDTSIRPRSITPHKTEAFLEPFPEDEPSSIREEPVIVNETTVADETEELGADENPISEETMQLRQSSRSVGSFEEGDESTITLRSRSNSSGTFSSSDGSAQVDWEELEKEEDQAPRDEGSDEVGFS